MTVTVQQVEFKPGPGLKVATTIRRGLFGPEQRGFIVPHLNLKPGRLAGVLQVNCERLQMRVLVSGSGPVRGPGAVRVTFGLLAPRPDP